MYSLIQKSMVLGRDENALRAIFCKQNLRGEKSEITSFFVSHI